MDSPKKIVSNEKKTSNNGYAVPQREAHLAQGIEWLMKMGFIDSPDVQMALTANIYAISEKIEEVALVADTERQKLLAFIRLRKLRIHNKIFMLIKNLFSSRSGELNEEDVGTLAVERLHQVLPDYDIRIVFNPEIYKKSKELAEKILKLRTEKAAKKEEPK